jgi:5-methyltetrahydropteroyltriglutamate--homocysteine methyltransferase
MKQQLKTSVIGSYPVHIEPMDVMHAYFEEKDVSWEPYIKKAVSDMVSAEIDVVSDGQTRDPFIQLFTRRLGGCRIRDRTEIIGPVEFTGSITVDDQRFVKSLLPHKKRLVGVLTGPFTLMKSSVDLFYHDEKKLCFDFAAALRKEAEALQNHVDLISIDEPFFSNELPEYAEELIGTISKQLSCPVRLHVCGDVARIVPRLVDMPVDILSHEFKASPHLLEIFKEYSASKKICLGSVRSDDARVESVEDIVTHIKKAQDIFGDHLVQIAPDCGQRLLPVQAAYQKLKHLVLAGEIINGR